MSEHDNSEPSSMSAAAKIFQLLETAASDGCAARLGRLSLPGRRPIDTPSYTAVTSRGVVPHLTPDHINKHTTIGSAYMGLEDFIEKKDPPIFSTPVSGNIPRLHSFTSLPLDRPTILGPRRFPAVTTPLGNGAKFMSIFTSTGFYSLTTKEYASAVNTLKPDVVMPLADLFHSSKTPSSKKLLRMVDRTEEWLDEFLKLLHKDADGSRPAVFASVLPVEHPIQWEYLKHLSEDVTEDISGLVIHNVNILPELTVYGSLTSLPKLSMDLPKSPHDILRQVSLGVDVCTIPFVNAVSDSGVAFSFSFPPPATSTVQSMGVDMWSPEHSTSLEPLSEGCQCYACAKHHRAYIHHLLNAKEMLGWNLLQTHNFHTLDRFFSGIRQTLEKGQSGFEQARQQFLAAYEPLFPVGAGERPRARGYHFKSERAQEKFNKPSWNKFDVENDGTPMEVDLTSIPVEGQAS